MGGSEFPSVNVNSWLFYTPLSLSKKMPWYKLLSLICFINMFSTIFLSLINKTVSQASICSLCRFLRYKFSNQFSRASLSWASSHKRGFIERSLVLLRTRDSELLKLFPFVTPLCFLGSIGWHYVT